VRGTLKDGEHTFSVHRSSNWKGLETISIVFMLNMTTFQCNDTADRFQHCPTAQMKHARSSLRTIRQRLLPKKCYPTWVLTVHLFSSIDIHISTVVMFWCQTFTCTHKHCRHNTVNANNKKKNQIMIYNHCTQEREVSVRVSEWVSKV